MEEVSRQRIREVIGAALSLASIPFTGSQLEAMVAGYFPPLVGKASILPPSGEINSAAEINHRRGAGAGMDRDSYVTGWQHCILYLIDKHGFEQL